MSDILDKVRKLRTLATSSNVHEAAAAAAAAERLIQEHNLAEASLEIDAAEETVTYERVTEFGQQVPSWQGVLLVHLARAYQCSGFIRPGMKSSYIAYGRPQDIATLKYQYAFFTAEITRLAKVGKGRGRTWLNSFRIGAVQAIAESLRVTQTAARQQATSSALVVVDERAARAEKRRNQDNPNLESRNRSAFRVDPHGLAAGRRAGSSINQRSQIGAGGTRLLS